MTDQRNQMIEQARQRLHPWSDVDVAAIAECENGLWYLKTKIIEPHSNEEVLNHRRVLKYARDFAKRSANVAFLREGPQQTADLKVQIGMWTIFVEVGKFEPRVGDGTSYPAQKIVSAVEVKRAQLPEGEIGFVAVDNFDLNVESMPDEGFTHAHITDGLCELDRLARENPGGWRNPSGVIVAAHTSGGASSVWPPAIPHYIWVNSKARPPTPPEVVEFMRSSLPNGELFDTRIRAQGVQ